jgi:hypothetical protein
MVPVFEIVLITGEVSVKPEKELALLPKEIEVEPMVTEELVNLALAIDPANMVLVTVPESPVVTTLPVVAGSVMVLVPAVPVATRLMVPEVEPAKFAPVPPTVGSVKVLLVRV